MASQRRGKDVIRRKEDGICPDWQDLSVAPIRRNPSMVPPYGLKHGKLELEKQGSQAGAWEPAEPEAGRGMGAAGKAVNLGG